MSGIAEQLDAKLRTLDAKAASSLEKLVRVALELVETQNGGARPEHLDPDFSPASPESSGANPSSGLRKVNSRSEKRGKGLPAGYQPLDFPAEKSGRQTRCQGPLATRPGDSSHREKYPCNS